MKSVHIGKIIQEQVAKSSKQHKQVADEINRTPQALRDMFEREHISTDMLMRLKEVLGYDFFKHYVEEENFLMEPEGTYVNSQGDSIVTVQFNLKDVRHVNLFKMYLSNFNII